MVLEGPGREMCSPALGQGRGGWQQGGATGLGCDGGAPGAWSGDFCKAEGQVGSSLS